MSLFKKLFKDLYPKQQEKKQEQITIDHPYASRDLAKNKEMLLSIFGKSIDVTCEPIAFANKKGYIFYLKSMVDSNEVNHRILTKLAELNVDKKVIITDDDLNLIKDEYFSGLSVTVTNEYRKLTENVLNGHVLLFLDRHEKMISIEIHNVQTRSIAEPSTQTIIRGPKDSFNEDYKTSISLIRRRVKNPKLQFEQHVVGEESRTIVTFCFLDGVVNKGILEEARKRIKSINIYAVLDSGNIEEAITDKTYTPFPLIFNTERPDVIAAGVLEGKIGIIVDGSPFVLMIPAVLTDFFQSSEDYYQPFLMSSFIRMIRYVSFMVSLILPSAYVAIVSFHHELLPTDLLISIQSQREGVPFPAVIEILIMELTFEILREAGVRMPRAVGQTVSIVGALVIGQAAVEAGLVSNVLVIVVAFTAIASFVSPIYNFAISTRLLRFLLIFCAAMLGLYGILLFLVFMVSHLAGLRSYGVPYLAPIAPLIMEDQQDVFVRLPNWLNKTRPTFLKTEQSIKMDEIRRPEPPKAGEES